MAWLAALNLAWEALQLPLYTIWTEGSFAAIAYAVFHCTVGDLLIGCAALLIALIIGREGSIATWRWRRIAVWMLVLGPAYTLFSEWLNTTLLRWSYSELMPTLKLGVIKIGVSPLLQWLILPPVALHLARRLEWAPKRKMNCR